MLTKISHIVTAMSDCEDLDPSILECPSFVQLSVLDKLHKVGRLWLSVVCLFVREYRRVCMYVYECVCVYICDECVRVLCVSVCVSVRKCV